MIPNYQRFYNLVAVKSSGLTEMACIGRHTSSFHFDYERIKGTENAKWLQLTGKQAIEKFVPVTRKSLLRRILEDVKIFQANELENFQQIATGIDSMLYVRYKKELDALKSLYNPLSPDRDTVQMKQFTSQQLTEREDKILMKLNGLMDEAGFYELPRHTMIEALEENNAAEKLTMAVSPENYGTLKFWIVGMDVVPLDERPWYVVAEERAQLVKQRQAELDPLSQNMSQKRIFSSQILPRLWKKLYGDSLRRVARYKRVIVAVRRKMDTKLLIKGFKDIPCENLEFLVPEGKMKMRTLDKIRLVVQSSSIMLFALSTTLTDLADMKIETSLAFGILAIIVLIRNGVFYKNLRNRCVLDLSQTLYFKSVASNHALLALMIDRAEDEVYKSSLLCFAFLHRRRCCADESHDVDSGMTELELKTDIQDWLLDRFEIKVNLSIDLSLNNLIDWKLIEVKQLDDKGIAYHSKHLKDAILSIPKSKRPPLFHHADLLAINIERASATETEQEPAYLSYEGRYDWE